MQWAFTGQLRSHGGIGSPSGGAGTVLRSWYDETIQRYVEQLVLDNNGGAWYPPGPHALSDCSCALYRAARYLTPVSLLQQWANLGMDHVPTAP